MREIGPRERAHYEETRKTYQAEGLCADFTLYGERGSFCAFCTKSAGHSDRHYDVVLGHVWENAQP